MSRIIKEFGNIYRDEGMGGLFSGAGARVVYLIVGGTVYFGVYEYARKVIEAVYIK